MKARIAVLAGDGIGPEVTAEGEGMERNVVPEHPCHRREAARGLGGDLRADTITGQHRDPRFHARRS